MPWSESIARISGLALRGEHGLALPKGAAGGGGDVEGVDFCVVRRRQASVHSVPTISGGLRLLPCIKHLLNNVVLVTDGPFTIWPRPVIDHVRIFARTFRYSNSCLANLPAPLLHIPVHQLREHLVVEGAHAGPSHL